MTAPSAEIIRDSVTEHGDRLTTGILTHHRWILAELNTHRALSKSSASSRAIPVAKQIARVEQDPALPVVWPAEQPGMQGGADLDSAAADEAAGQWRDAADDAVRHARALSNRYGVHKSVTNRVLEPFMMHTVVITGTAWQNFFSLRANPLAQPEFRVVAEMMKRAYDESIPQVVEQGDWHLPFVEPEEAYTLGRVDAVRVSTARCARVSYLTHDGRRDTDADLQLYRRLTSADPMHCYDSETEVLTERGWVKWPDVETSDLLAAVDINSGAIEFEIPAALQHGYHEGKMYRLTGQQVDLLVTPGHRLISASRRSGGSWTPFGFSTAEELAGRPHRVLKAGMLGPRQGLSNPWGIEPETFAALVGFFIGDGHAHRTEAWNPNRITFHLRKARKIEFLRSLGLPMTEGVSFTVALPGIGTWFRANCYTAGAQKCLPPGFLSMTGSEWFALSTGLRESDGAAKRNTWTYTSTSERLLGEIQALAHLNGEVASLSWTTPFGQRSQGRLNFSHRLTPRIEPNQATRSRTYSEGWEAFEGDVWCATVSTGALLVRRNGKVVVSGNSVPLEHVATPAPENRHNVRVEPRLTSSGHRESGMTLNLPRYGNLVGWHSHRYDVECAKRYQSFS
ncbi:MAG: hypothetical protein NVS3B1_20470 [Marmoricola sp.]